MSLAKTVAPTFKNAVVSLRSKKKNVCYLELGDIYLQLRTKPRKKFFELL